MDRKEAYRTLKEMHLEEGIKSAFGKNYTQVKTEDLETFILEAKIQAGVTEATAQKPVSVSKKVNAVISEVENPYEAACLTFLGVLSSANLLDGLLTKLNSN